MSLFNGPPPITQSDPFHATHCPTFTKLEALFTTIQLIPSVDEHTQVPLDVLPTAIVRPFPEANPLQLDKRISFPEDEGNHVSPSKEYPRRFPPWPPAIQSVPFQSSAEQNVLKIEFPEEFGSQ
jgi:hypothetical protein